MEDPGCLSRIPDPDFYPSRISDPKTATKERGEKFSYHNFLCSHKFLKIANYFSFGVPKKKIQRIIEFFTQKLSLSSQKYGFGIRGPEKNLFKSQKGTGSRIRIRNTAMPYITKLVTKHSQKPQTILQNINYQSCTQNSDDRPLARLHTCPARSLWTDIYISIYSYPFAPKPFKFTYIDMKIYECSLSPYEHYICILHISV